RVTQRLVACHLGAEAGLEQPPRRLARPEAGDLHLTRELAERGVDRLLEVGRGNGDVEPDLVALERFDRGLERHGDANVPGDRELASPLSVPRRRLGAAHARLLASPKL